MAKPESSDVKGEIALVEDLFPRSAQRDFFLQRMEVIHQAAGGKADLPHRHDYFTIILVKTASGRHIIDFNEYELKDKQVYFIAPGQIHRLMPSTFPEGWVITFTTDFLVQNDIPLHFLTNVNLFSEYGNSPPLALDEVTFARLAQVALEIASCLPTDLHYRNRALGALLQLFLIYANNACTMDQSQLDEDAKGVCVLRDFKEILERDFRKTHLVKAYAIRSVLPANI